MQQEQTNIWRRILQFWLRRTSPDPRIFGPGIEDQERKRRSRLLSALLALVFIPVLLAAPTAIPVPSYWIPIISLIVLSVIAAAFNRKANITLSGLFFIFAIDATLTILLATTPHGIRNSNIPDFDLFIIPTLIGGVVLLRRFLPFLAGLHIIIIITLFALLPHDPLLQQEIQVNQGGFAYSEISDALIIQIVSAIIAWLSAWSVDRALSRANRAEDLAEARKRLGEQAHYMVEQKERIDYGITVLKDAHARVANGEYKARAKLQNNELTSLAMSFNLMAERLNRISQIAQEYRRIEQGLQQLLELQDSVSHGGALKPLPPSGTLVDRLYPAVQRYYYLRSMTTRSGSSIEKIRTNLAQQEALISQLTTVLAHAYSLAQLSTSQLILTQPLEAAQQLCIQIKDQEKRSMQETKALDQLLKEI
ncbi:MAG: hypothetical protein H0V70_14985 [Ktedonobacteraceae bacterium]|nr:hypothetical protein [Ktedonobacteraceae bacterium]